MKYQKPTVARVELVAKMNHVHSCPPDQIYVPGKGCDFF